MRRLSPSPVGRKEFSSDKRREEQRVVFLDTIKIILNVVPYFKKRMKAPGFCLTLHSVMRTMNFSF